MPAEQELFGGALSTRLPPDVKNVSEFRQIPDHQEVFAHTDTDQSIIIEILEYVNEPDEIAIRTHFEDLALSNCAASDEDSQLLNIDKLDLTETSMSDCENIYYILGQHKIAKFKESSKNQVNIHMALFRLPRFTTDILVTFNDPININPDSSSHKPIPVSVAKWTDEDFKMAVTSLKINDISIFGS